jgi:cation transport ATPase
MAEVRLHVHGMDCAEETALIRRALAGNSAVTSLDFDLIHAFVHVGFDGTRTTAQDIADAIRRTGLNAHETGAADAPDQSLHTHEHHYPHGEYSTWWAIASGVSFLIGWVIEGSAAEHWSTPGPFRSTLWPS